MIISLDKYKKTGQLKPEEELHIELTENGVFEYLPPEGSVYSKAIVIVNVTSAEPEPEPSETPELSFTGLTLYPGVEYMMVGETYDMTFETDYEPGTYEIFTQQYPVEVDYDNKVLRITPTGSGFAEFCMYIYDGDIYEGERYLEVQVPAKYKALVDIGVLEFTSNYCVNYEISEEVENYWFEIDNCAVETNHEEKCIYVNPEYNGVFADSNNVRLCWDSNVGVCHATLNELPPFTVPEDFPAVHPPGASSWVNGDNVVIQINCQLLDDNRPMPTIQIWNGGALVHTYIPEVQGSLDIELPTSDFTSSELEIAAIADYNGNNYEMSREITWINGWEDNNTGGDDSGNIEIDTAKWGNPDEAQAVSWSEFEAAEPISINTETGEVSNAQWYELTGTLVCAPQMETGRWILGDPDGTFSQNLTDDSGNLREHSIFINRLEATPVFPGDGATITIKTLKHVATIEEAGLSWLHGPEGEIIFGGSYKDSPAAIYVSGPDEPDVPDIIL